MTAPMSEGPGTGSPAAPGTTDAPRGRRHFSGRRSVTGSRIELGDVLLEVENLKKYFPMKSGHHPPDHRPRQGRRRHLLRGAPGRDPRAWSASPGCGKSTAGRTVLQLLAPTGGHDPLQRPGHHRCQDRRPAPLRTEMQMVFQDPYGSLNPRTAVGAIVGAPVRHPAHRARRTESRPRCRSSCERVGLNPEHYNRYPHEFSGGQRQRIGIARAIALPPEADRVRRAGLGPRRVDPGAGRQPARGPAERVRPHVPLHRPRPVRGAPHQRPGRRDVPRQDHGDRRPGRALRQPAAPLHPGAAVGGPAAGSTQGAQALSASCSRATCPPR